MRRVRGRGVFVHRRHRLLRHDVVADREAKPGAFTSRLRREEWLKELVSDVGRNANAIIPYLHLDGIAKIPCRHLQRRLEIRVATLLLALGGRIEAVAEKVQTDPRDVLGTSSIGAIPSAKSRSSVMLKLASWARPPW